MTDSLPRPRWTHCFLAVNTLVFLAITWSSGDLFGPPGEDLLRFGAKAPQLLAQGQWWRYATPIFLHIGIIHFVLNNLALKYVGRYIEVMLGNAAFFGIYLITGMAGNIASSLSNVQIGAGASGAIFGLIGVGLVFEWLVQAHERRLNQEQGISLPRQRMGPFTSMALLNIGLAFALNFLMAQTDGASIGIDNAAHFGGLGSGIVLGFAFLSWRPNVLIRRRPLVALACLVILSAGLAAGAYLGTRPAFVAKRFLEAALQYDDLPHQLFYIGEGLKLEDDHPELRFARGRLLLLAGHPGHAYRDFAVATPARGLLESYRHLEAELRAAGRLREADELAAYYRRPG